MQMILSAFDLLEFMKLDLHFANRGDFSERKCSDFSLDGVSTSARLFGLWNVLFA
jgi:hypothetical protein